MNEESPRGAQVTTEASKGGGWKLLAGVAAAAVLLGGGYFAWKNFGPAQPGSEAAYNDTYSTEPVHAGPLPPDQAGSTQTATANENSGQAASSETQMASAAPVHRRSATSAAAVPEEVVGVIPVSETTQEGEDIIVRGGHYPVWTRAPSARRLSAAYPERALERGREGEASVHCTVQHSGALNCVPVSETPAHAGFGNAALRVARMYRHAPQRADGSAADGSPVNLRVVFRVADDNRRG